MKNCIHIIYNCLKYLRHSKYFSHSELIFIILLLLYPGRIFSQKVLTLKECYEKAYAASPLANEKKSYTGLWQLKELNLSRGWLPTLDANGSFIYNSSVVNMTDVIGNLPVPGIADLITPLPHEQYKVTLEINQMIYDGGAIKGTKKNGKSRTGHPWQTDRSRSI